MSEDKNLKKGLLLATAGALSMAELVTAMPKAGGDCPGGAERGF